MRNSQRKIDKMETKQCKNCKQVLTLDKFEKDIRYVGGVINTCKKCRYQIKANRKNSNPEIKEEYSKKLKEWRGKTPELEEQRRIRTYINFLTNRGYIIIEPSNNK